MKGCEVVFHGAAKVALYGKWSDFQRDTVDGTVNIVCAADAAGVKRFVHVGTEAVLAPGGALRNADEGTPIPKCDKYAYPYSYSKVLCTNLSRLPYFVHDLFH